jgi:hypothetical protein
MSEEFYLLGYDVVQSGVIQTTFRRNITPLFLWSMSKSVKQLAVTDITCYLIPLNSPWRRRLYFPLKKLSFDCTTKIYVPEISSSLYLLSLQFIKLGAQKLITFFYYYKIAVCWDMMPYRFVGMYRSFNGTFHCTGWLPENKNFYNHCHENIKSHKTPMVHLKFVGPFEACRSKHISWKIIVYQLFSSVQIIAYVLIS